MNYKIDDVGYSDKIKYLAEDSFSIHNGNG